MYAAVPKAQYNTLGLCYAPNTRRIPAKVRLGIPETGIPVSANGWFFVIGRDTRLGVDHDGNVEALGLAAGLNNGSGLGGW